MTYLKPKTPLPWDNFDDNPTCDKDARYIIHAANAFPHLVAALEMLLDEATHHETGRMKARKALAIARGE